MENVANSSMFPCTHLPRKTGAVRGLPLPSISWTKIYGLPPTPPLTGCFGMVIVAPCGTALAVAVDVYECVPSALFWNVNCGNWAQVKCPVKRHVWSWAVGTTRGTQPDLCGNGHHV